MSQEISNLASAYDPKLVEKKWYALWQELELSKAGKDQSKKPFTIVIPPPNVTGQLHMGHALDNAMQDVLIRWHRMLGDDALWLPGTDHAGIATQARVEEELSKQGVSRFDIGRDSFLEHVWTWKDKYGHRISEQLKSMGASCDWSRERFTLDEGLSRAVRESFVRYYEKGLIYKGIYIVNWCPHCRTVISDIEVDHDEREGKLYYLRYPFAEGEGSIVLATTRPETMLGDVAVAVHPEDERYKSMIGRHLRLPLIGRLIPIIADESVDPDFGTGCVKITPAHDPNDFLTGQRHNLEQINVINKDATMNENAGSYEGQERYQCRKQIIIDLEELDLIEKIDDHTHAVGTCSRCDTVIEPMISEQWFVKMEPLAKPAIEAVQNGRIKFIPERFTRTYLNWMENIRDWCISRQLWWGHRIPAWTCPEGHITVAVDDPTLCPICGSTHLEQDPDVLDTWFSSALWPFSTLGWPDKTADLERYFPTDVLVTGYDIISFWVVRMIFSSLELIDREPFHTVLIHGMVRDASGRKMSKSLNNGIDPVDIVEQYGADALRFMLLHGSAPGNDMRFQQERIESARNFANKTWNATRFVLMNLQDFHRVNLSDCELGLSERWIISRLNQVIDEVTLALEKFDFGETTRVLYDFLWTEYCDWYIELAKASLNGDDAQQRAQTQTVLVDVLTKTMELLHPVMPFITEEIWQHLPVNDKPESIMVAKWPTADASQIDEAAIRAMNEIMEITRSVRNVRAELGVAPSRKIILKILPNNEEGQLLSALSLPLLQRLTNAAKAEEITTNEIPAKAMSVATSRLIVYLPLEDLIDLDVERQRITKEIANLHQEIDRLSERLNNQGFLAKAPATVVDAERQKLADYQEKLASLNERLLQLT